MKALSWQPVSGAPGAEVYPWLRKPHCFSSNSYLVRTPEALAVIDPGGLPEQTAALADLVREELVRRPRPVHILLTHCHLDHSREAAGPGFWREVPGAEVFIHARGARALGEADRRLTQEEILGGGLEPFNAARPLFADGRKRETIPLGSGAAIEALPAPGHSPDGVIYRLGETDFIGDLLSAVTPLIAGIPGWHREDLIGSLKAALARIDAGEVRVCCPGHGRPLLGEDIARVFRRALAEASALEGIETADASRVKYVSGRARRLFVELEAAFSLVRERLERLSSRLDYLEEWSAAREISAILDSAEVARLLGEFRDFSARFRPGRDVEIGVALKAVLIAHRIFGLLDYQGLAEVLDPALLRLTRGLLEDYIAEARGFRLEGEEETDLEELVRELAGEGGPEPPGLEEIPDDPEGFTRYLVRTLARPHWSRTLEVRTVPAGRPLLLRAGRRRLRDIISILFQEIAGSDPRKSLVGNVKGKNHPPKTILAVQFCPRNQDSKLN